MSNAIEQKGGFASYLLDAFRSSVANRTVGSELNDGKSTADEQAAILASQLPKITFAAIGEGILFYAAKANLDLEKFARNLPNGYDRAIQLATDKWSKIHMLQEINSQLEKNFGESKKLLMAQKNEVIKSLSVINDGIKNIAKTYPDLGINPTDDPKAIFDKVLGHTEVSANVFDLLGKIFNYTEFVRMSVQDVNTADSENVSNYIMNWITYSSQLAGPADRFINNGLDSGLLSKIPVLSAKNLVSIAARGVLTGILTDMSYKAGYAVGEWIWNDVFEYLYDGQTAYEIYADEFEALYSTIFSHLTADKLNAVIAFNTMILGNFVNEQGKSVITEDTAILFGSDDYKSMDFDKALKSYKKLYKAVSGKDDAKNITGAEELIRHMEGSYPLFKEYRGKLLNILQGLEDTEELFTLS